MQQLLLADEAVVNSVAPASPSNSANFIESKPSHVYSPCVVNETQPPSPLAPSVAALMASAAGVESGAAAAGDGENFAMKINQLQRYISQRSTAPASLPTTKTIVFTEALADGAVDKFTDFRENLLVALRIVGQDKILTGVETIESYYQSGEMLIAQDGVPVMTRTMPATDRGWEREIMAWMDNPALCICPNYPNVQRVVSVCTALSAQLLDLWIGSFFHRRRLLWNTLAAILLTNRRANLHFTKFKGSYVNTVENEYLRGVSLALSNDSFSSAYSPSAYYGRSAPRARFIARVASACDTVEEWRRDPAALWRTLVETSFW